jgi:hypothetical protein
MPGMSIPVGANDLKIYRRHASYCTRYPSGSKKPDTYRPSRKKDQKADSCQCPIWCRGYLAKHTQIVKGKIRPKRLFASLDTNDWTAAEQEIARLYQRGSPPPVLSAGQLPDTSATLLDGALANRLRQVALAGAARSEEQGIFAFADEGAGGQVEDQAAVHLGV